MFSSKPEQDNVGNHQCFSIPKCQNVIIKVRMRETHINTEIIFLYLYINPNIPKINVILRFHSI